LRSRRALLVLDNCEHVVEGAARLVQTVADGCPHVRVLATSREGLGTRVRP
jgi:predicted ATPase